MFAQHARASGSLAADVTVSPLAVRRFHLSDVGALLTLFSRSVREIGSLRYSPAQVEVWAGTANGVMWAMRMMQSATFIAECNGGIVGFLELDDHAYIRMLYRLPEIESRGAAQLLYDAAEAEARAHGTRRITTDASRLSEHFFLRNGFTLIERETVYREGIGIPRARMAKEL